MPTIAVINESNGVSDADAGVWGVEQARFTLLPHARISRTQPPAAGAWWVVFLDDGDQAAALAYRDLTNEGLPLAKVFVGDLLGERASVSVGASHEICEMAVDPWLNSAYQDSTGVFWAADVCDPVEDDAYGYEIAGVLVSDFVTPGWFGRPPGGGVLDAAGVTGGRLDLREHADTPFQILSGGYAQLFQGRKGWMQVIGHEAMKSPRARTPAKGSRRERRVRQAAEPLKLSRRRWCP
jgi:hypothetical protein